MAAQPPKRFDELARWLPGLLSGRLRVGPEQAFNLTGDYILYWMHSALRLQESPALDFACLLEERLGKPLVIVLTIATDMPGANERSLLFLRQGAREVKAGAAALRLPVEIFHGSIADLELILAKLCRKAVAVVTDDTPVKWQAKLSVKVGRQNPGPIFYVDGDALIPEAQMERMTFSSFADYCEKTTFLRTDQFGTPWKALFNMSALQRERPGNFPVGNLPESETDWLADLSVTHELGPVSHRSGGCHQAQALWHDIRALALRRGDITRFAELVPYLRFGMITPQRIAFEALLDSTPAALTFMQDTLLLRHYAGILCARQPIYGTSHSLPTWARQSLQNIPQTLDPGTHTFLSMARGETGDRHWDDLQKKFRREGTLAQSGYDFWCKHLLVALPSQLREVKDLLRFHGQFALNSDDPWTIFQVLNSLGLEKTPAPKTSPVYGLLTPPDVPVPAAAVQVSPVAVAPKQFAIAVIGAGISGLACARQLQEDGYQVTVFEQEQRPGGRVATYRAGGVAFDVGAPILTMKSQVFRSIAESWQQMGLLQVWNSKIYVRDKDAGLSLSKDPLVPVPTMDALPRQLAGKLDIVYGARIDRVVAVSGGWRLTDAKGGDQGFYDVVVFAVPPMAAKSIEGMPEISKAVVSKVTFFPMWVAMLAFHEPLPVPYDAVAVAREAVRYAFRENRKPARQGGEQWVLHSSPEWSLANTGLRPPVAAQKLLKSFLGVFNLDATVLKPAYGTAMQWSRAQVVKPVGKSHLWYPARIAFCGDWCLGRRIEDAYLSGVAAAARIRNELR